MFVVNTVNVLTPNPVPTNFMSTASDQQRPLPKTSGKATGTVVVWGGRNATFRLAVADLRRLMWEVLPVESAGAVAEIIARRRVDALLLDGQLRSRLSDLKATELRECLIHGRTPVVWIDRRRDVLAEDPCLAQVLLGSPFTQLDLADALGLARWCHSATLQGVQHNRRITSDGLRALPPVHSTEVSVSQATQRADTRARRPTDAYTSGRKRKEPGAGNSATGQPASDDATRSIRAGSRRQRGKPGRKNSGIGPRPRRGSGSHALASDFSDTSEFTRAGEINGGEKRSPGIAAILKSKPANTPEDPSATPGDQRRPPDDLNRRGDFAHGVVMDDRYQIIQPLGSGGMARVYKAVDLELDDIVAIKVLREDRATPVAAERFRREMRLCRRLVHRNIVRTYEFGSWSGQLYYTMELLVGRDLAALMCVGAPQLSMEAALSLCVQACDGLGAAHNIGIVHRDVKPHNMMVVEAAKTLKITDFGVARDDSSDSSNLTLDSHVVGTPAYLAPERLRDQESLSIQTDIYSLGASLYQIFAGVLPFDGGSVEELLLNILNEPPEQPVRHNPLIPERLNALIMRLLEKNPAERLGSCAEVRDELLLTLAEVAEP